MRTVTTHHGELILKDEIEIIFEKKVTKFGNGAKIDCPREFLEKNVYVLIRKDNGRKQSPLRNYFPDGYNRHGRTIPLFNENNKIITENFVDFVEYGITQGTIKKGKNTEGYYLFSVWKQNGLEMEFRMGTGSNKGSFNTLVLTPV